MIAVTGASGEYGRQVVECLLDAGVPAREVVAVVRSPEKVADLAARGVVVRQADYDDPVALRGSLAGVERLLLVSGTEVGLRVAQHGRVVDAAKDAGVGLLAYTSGTKADRSDLPIAPDHAATERLLAESGIPAVTLRHNWYLENYAQAIAQAAATGSVIGSAGDGRIGAATKADFAAAAAAVLTADPPMLGTFELGGDESWTLTELAATVAAESGSPVAYVDLPPAELTATLVGFGLPQQVAELLTTFDECIARGALHTGSHDLSTLIGRPTTTLAEYVHRVLTAD